jgi:hypothetical protein
VVSGRAQLFAQRKEIVNRAVEDDGHGTIWCHHRLAACVAQVENGKVPMSQNRAIETLDPFSIPPTMRQRAQDIPYCHGGIFSVWRSDKSGYSAHKK